MLKKGNKYIQICKLGNALNANEACPCMLIRKCLLAMLILMLVILMVILMLLNLNTCYADTDLCIRIMSLCCNRWKISCNVGNMSDKIHIPSLDPFLFLKMKITSMKARSSNPTTTHTMVILQMKHSHLRERIMREKWSSRQHVPKHFTYES